MAEKVMQVFRFRKEIDDVRAWKAVCRRFNSAPVHFVSTSPSLLEYFFISPIIPLSHKSLQDNFPVRGHFRLYYLVSCMYSSKMSQRCINCVNENKVIQREIISWIWEWPRHYFLIQNNLFWRAFCMNINHFRIKRLDIEISGLYITGKVIGKGTSTLERSQNFRCRTICFFYSLSREVSAFPCVYSMVCTMSDW